MSRSNRNYRAKKTIDSVCSLEDVINDKECLKICVFGVPPQRKATYIENLLKTIEGFEYCKIKRFTNSSYFHLIFVNAEQKEKNFPIFVEKFALSPGEKVKFGKATATYGKRSQREEVEGESENPNKKVCTYDDDVLDIVSVTTPWWKKPYEEQLLDKKKYMNSILKKITKSAHKDSNKEKLPNWLKELKNKNKPCCQFEKVYEAPVKEGYRNKNSFTIGRDRNGNSVIGFTLGAVRDDIVTVADPKECKILSERGLKSRNLFQNYVEKSNFTPFDKITKKGFWRQLTYREFTTGDGMAIFQVNPDGLSEEELNKQKEDLINYCKEQESTESLYWQEWSGVSNVADANTPIILLLGSEIIYENLLGLKFRISPNAFFQVNLKSAEILYTLAREWAGADENTVIVDVCCGTGTIGLTMAKSVKKVIGLELEVTAVEDAIVNASLNEIENAVFIAGKAEDVIGKALAEITNENVVAIVDPPRAGLHNDVLKALKKCEQISKIVYISCNPNSLVPNASLLCRGQSKSTPGTPFKPARAAAVDMFPHTDNVEGIVLFTRDLDSPQ